MLVLAVGTRHPLRQPCRSIVEAVCDAALRATVEDLPYVDPAAGDLTSRLGRS